MEGKGLFVWKQQGKSFNGDWLNNMMHGSGIFSWTDGRRYVGEYKEDKKSGYGEFFWPDGRYYKGYWKEGKQNGKGTYKGSKMLTER